MSVISVLKQKLQHHLGNDLELKDLCTPPARKPKIGYKSREEAIAAYGKFEEWGRARNAELAAGKMTPSEAREFCSILKSEHAAWTRLAESFKSA